LRETWLLFSILLNVEEPWVRLYFNNITTDITVFERPLDV
jgi:hypothetical protein